MAELVYAFDLKSNEGTRAGSIPAPSTKNTEKTTCSLFLYFERVREDFPAPSTKMP